MRPDPFRLPRGASFVAMRRFLPLVLLASVTVAACGSADTSEPASSTPDSVLDATPGSDGAYDVSSTVATAESTEPTCVPDGGEAPAPDLEGAEPPPTSPDKPEVELPSAAPSELVRNVLQEGTGEPAAAGDTVIVDYIGVRADDGLEFDNSYDREPFPVVLGQGNVIQGWDEGLIGAQTGERVQLDIPSDLAYGPDARSAVICENEDLSFVIDVRVVVGAVDPADVPTEPGIPFSEGATDTTFEDLVVGEGASLEIGQTAVIRYVNFRGDNGVVLETNWGPDPLQVPFGENLLPGLLEGMTGMNVGGRRAITIPPVDGFGEDGNPEGGLPIDTDMIFLIELLGTY